MKGRTYRYFNDPLFAFGYGLSYTQFEIGEAKVTPQGDNFVLEVPVSNMGKRDGVEVVQVYVRDTRDTEGPLKSLRAFQRVTVKAGQTAQAKLTLTPESFELFDTDTNTMRTKPGTYEVFYGNSSQDSALKKVMINIRSNH